ncbi:MAG: PQQ-binding-like beta-propeller repeat protein [Elusimicrobia bacterium]|nr:PQQ-binding-like beta-propeller repeat protein [Elusimicrobiota bacterium]
MRGTCLWMALVMAAPGFAGRAWAGAKLWEKKLDSDVVWKQFHDAGVVLTVTKKGNLYGFDPKTGEEKFKVEDLLKPLTPDEIPGRPYVVPDSPLVVVVTKAGMIKPEVISVLDVTTGKAGWTLGSEVPQASWAALLEGKEPSAPPQATFSGLHSAILDPNRMQLVLFTAGATLWKGEPMKSKYYRMLEGTVAGVDLATGKLNFVAAYAGDPGTYDTVKDGGLQIVGDNVLIDWNGVMAYRLTDGAEVVSASFKRALKKGRYALQGAHARTIVEGDVAYLVVKDHVEAWDMKTGQRKWEAEGTDSAIPELHLAGDKLVVRIGGVFCFTSAGQEQCVDQDPYGVVVYDKASGKQVFHTKEWDKKSKNILITPLAIANGLVYWGTSARLIALDLESLQVKFTTELNGNDPNENPGGIAVEGGKVYLMNTQTTGAFDAATGSLLWSKTVPATKMDAAMKMALTFTKAVAALDAVQRAYSRAQEGGLGSDDVWAKKTAAALGQTYGAGYDNMMKRMSAADEAGQFNYVMTGKAKDAVVVGVNTKTGEVERGTQVEGRVPEFMVDPVSAVLVNVSKSDPKWVMGFDMSAPLPEFN